MTKNVRIFIPPQNPMQSAKGRTLKWTLEYQNDADRHPEPLMGWTSTDSTLNQVRLLFDTREQAIGFAEKNGWPYIVEPENKRKITPRNYADNFRYMPPETETPP